MKTTLSGYKDFLLNSGRIRDLFRKTFSIQTQLTSNSNTSYISIRFIFSINSDEYLSPGNESLKIAEEEINLFMNENRNALTERIENRMKEAEKELATKLSDDALDILTKARS